MGGVSIRDHQVEDLKIFFERNALKLTSDEPMRSRLLWAMCPTTLYLTHPPCIYTICTHSCIRHVPTLLYLWGVTQDTEVRTAVGESFRNELRSLVYRYFVPIQAIISWLVSVPSTDLAVLKVNIIFFDSSHLEKASLYEVILEWLLPHRIVSRLP